MCLRENDYTRTCVSRNMTMYRNLPKINMFLNFFRNFANILWKTLSVLFEFLDTFTYAECLRHAVNAPR